MCPLNGLIIMMTNRDSENQFFLKDISTFMIKESKVVSSVMTFQFIRYLNFPGPWLLIVPTSTETIPRVITPSPRN